MSAKPEHYDLIKKPIITEKATMASENGAVVFQVAMDATKPQIKEAVGKKEEAERILAGVQKAEGEFFHAKMLSEVSVETPPSDAK